LGKIGPLGINNTQIGNEINSSSTKMNTIVLSNLQSNFFDDAGAVNPMKNVKAMSFVPDLEMTHMLSISAFTKCCCSHQPTHIENVKDHCVPSPLIDVELQIARCNSVSIFSFQKKCRCA